MTLRISQFAQLLGNLQAQKLLGETLAEEEATDKKLTELGESGINDAAAAATSEADEE